MISVFFKTTFQTQCWTNKRPWCNISSALELLFVPRASKTLHRSSLPSAESVQLEKKSATTSGGPRTNGSLTLVAVAHSVKVHVVLVVGEEEQAEPGVEGVDGHDEEDPDDVALLPRGAVEAQVHVDLGGKQKHKGRTFTGATHRHGDSTRRETREAAEGKSHRRKNC